MVSVADDHAPDPLDRPGLERRYSVQRLNDPELKHNECRFFVLDPQHDPFARMALAAYIIACEDDYPALATDLALWLRDTRPHQDPVGKNLDVAYETLARNEDIDAADEDD